MRPYKKFLGDTFRALSPLDLDNLQSDEFERIAFRFRFIVVTQIVALVATGLLLGFVVVTRNVSEPAISWMPIAMVLVIGCVASIEVARRQLKRAHDEVLHGASAASVAAFKDYCDQIDIALMRSSEMGLGVRYIAQVDEIMVAQQKILPIQLSDGRKQMLLAKRSALSRRVVERGIYDD